MSSDPWTRITREMLAGAEAAVVSHATATFYSVDGARDFVGWSTRILFGRNFDRNVTEFQL